MSTPCTLTSACANIRPAQLSHSYHSHGIRSLSLSFPLHLRQFAVPAILYAIFNMLAFYNLRLVSPPTYRLLINLKVLFSGLLLQGLVGTRLSRRQWIGLVILVAACGVEQWDSFDYNTGLMAILLICFQAFCSSFAGVYFQLLLQLRPHSSTPTAASQELGLWEKNFFMYTWSILFNIAYLMLMNTEVLLNPGQALSTFDANVIPIVLLSGIGGVSTSLILRDMDVIVKEYANFAEMYVHRPSRHAHSASDPQQGRSCLHAIALTCFSSLLCPPSSLLRTSGAWSFSAPSSSSARRSTRRSSSPSRS